MLIGLNRRFQVREARVPLERIVGVAIENRWSGAGVRRQKQPPQYLHIAKELEAAADAVSRPLPCFVAALRREVHETLAGDVEANPGVQEVVVAVLNII